MEDYGVTGAGAIEGAWGRDYIGINGVIGTITGWGGCDGSLGSDLASAKSFGSSLTGVGLLIYIYIIGDCWITPLFLYPGPLSLTTP